MNAGKILIGVLSGVAVGATVGILFAPYKGSKTRKIISMKKDKYVDELEEKYTDLIGSITEIFDRMRGEAELIVKKGKQDVEDIESEVMHTMPGK